MELAQRELPEDRGTYILVACLSRVQRVEIGGLGKCEVIPGYYLYVGSAFGSGGLRARIGHHLESGADPHWHIDYLLRCAVVTEVWFTTADQKLERHWAELLEHSAKFRVPIPRFGSSDYHRSRASHLLYSKRPPSFRSFEQSVMERFEDVWLERFIVAEPQ